MQYVIVPIHNHESLQHCFTDLADHGWDARLATPTEAAVLSESDVVWTQAKVEEALTIGINVAQQLAMAKAQESAARAMSQWKKAF